MKASRIILATVMGVCLIGVVLWAALLGGFIGVVDSVRDEMRAKSFSGNVISVTEGAACFKTLKVNTSSGILSESVCECGIQRDFLRYVEVDDVVNKVKDSLVIIVARPSTEKVARFIYPVCDH